MERGKGEGRVIGEINPDVTEKGHRAERESGKRKGKMYNP